MSNILILAIGGHALDMQLDDERDDYDFERRQIDRLCPVFAALAAKGYRLLVVHGNGPQVGRLMHGSGGMTSLDIHVAQSQGELGYLLASALPVPAVSFVTRVCVPEDAGMPVKPIGGYLERPHPSLPCEQFGTRWRVVVPSPRPVGIVEVEAVHNALSTHHVVAGGGGGVPVDGSGRPVMAVVDKDWVALELALAVDAARLVFITNVDHVYRRFGHPDAEPLETLDVPGCEKLLASDELGKGSMHPKLAAAAAFVQATGRSATIGSLKHVNAMLEHQAGTQVLSERASLAS